MSKFVDLYETPSFNIYILAKTGKLDYLEGDPGFNATMRVLSALGFDEIKFNDKSAEPMEEQFWKHVDAIYNLPEEGLKAHLPILITDPQNRVAVEALLAEHGTKEKAITE